MTARLTTPARALVAAALLALAGCSSQGTGTGTGSGTGTGTSASTAAESVTIDDAWVKAAENGMSAAFGDLRNTGDREVTVTSATSPASTVLELHETVEDESGEMVMRERDSGFTIPAGGELLLAPGGNHIMLMDLVEPIAPGTEVTFTLTFSDGSTLDLTAPAKDYSGANESYEDGETEMGDMDHPDADHSETDTGE